MTVDTRFAPLFAASDRIPPEKATMLAVVPCETELARYCNGLWHSRLPTTQRGPWTHAFAAVHDGWVYGVALWNSPSARTLPSHWRELRRLAVAPDAPHCTASRMLGQMVRWFRVNEPHTERLISYQDLDVHDGTIYRAAGWTVGLVSKPRQRDRTGQRAGTQRLYRWDINGAPPAGAGKARWEITL